LLAQGVVVTIAIVAWGCLPRKNGTTNIGSATAVRPANNSECLICHMDFKSELSSHTHYG
jgi:hypothetical protein